MHLGKARANVLPATPNLCKRILRLLLETAKDALRWRQATLFKPVGATTLCCIGSHEERTPSSPVHQLALMLDYCSYILVQMQSLLVLCGRGVITHQHMVWAL